VLADLFLDVGGRGVDGNIDGAGGWIGLLSSVDGAGGETGLFGGQKSLLGFRVSTRILGYIPLSPRSFKIKDLASECCQVFEE
jgi:hypothetical protein